MGVFAVEIPLQEFERAAQRLKGVLHHTELDLSATFSAMTGGNIYLKYENSQIGRAHVLNSSHFR